MKTRSCKTDGCALTFIGATQRKYCDVCKSARSLAAAIKSAKDNPERTAKNKRNWVRMNPQKATDARTAWRLSNPNKQSAAYRKSRFSALVGAGRTRGIEVTISREEYEHLANLPCHYCGGELPPNGYGIDRINNTVGYVQGNCRACCSDCNLAKRTMTESQFKQWVSRVFVHWISPSLEQLENRKAA